MVVYHASMKQDYYEPVSKQYVELPLTSYHFKEKIGLECFSLFSFAVGDLFVICCLQLLEMDSIKVISGNKQSDPNLWLDRLAAIFR